MTKSVYQKIYPLKILFLFHFLHKCLKTLFISVFHKSNSYTYLRQDKQRHFFLPYVSWKLFLLFFSDQHTVLNDALSEIVF